MDCNNYLFNLPVHENTCRTCLKSLEGNNYKKFIFKPNIKDKIRSLTSVNLYEADGLPNFICEICLEKLNSALEFKKQVEATNEVLKQYVNNGSVTTDSVLIIERVTPGIIRNLSNQNIGEKLLKTTDKIEADNCSDNYDEIDEESTNNLVKLSNQRKTTAKKRNTYVECPSCPKKFKNNTCLKTHLRIHGVIEKKIECDICGKKYSNQYDLKVHSRKHSGVRPFSCQICQKTFADQRCFEKHKKIHSGEKLFKCELCDKSFIHSYTLKIHLRVHSGEKPYICAKCGHSFTTTTQLKLHSRIHHTQEKPYSCRMCSKVFASSSGLSNHNMTHTGERKFICSVCGKGSRTTSDLKCHLRTHTGERPFQCTFPDCDKKYKTNSQLCYHIRTHTGEKNRK